MVVADVVLLVIVLSAVVVGVNAVGRAVTQMQSRARDPKSILDERFARGEIDEHEYGRRLAILQMGPPLEMFDLPPPPPPRTGDDD